MPFDINDPDTKAAIDKIKADADGRIEAMDRKVTEALDEAKKAKAEARKLKDIDPADLTKLEDENSALKADLAKVQKDAKDAAKALDDTVKKLNEESGFSSKMLTDNALNQALAEAGVKEPAMLKAVKAMMAGGATVATENGERVVKVADKNLADHIKAWAGTDEAKHFISAPDSSGGGAQGGTSGGNGKTMTRQQYNEKIVSDPAGMNAFIKDGGKVINAGT